MVEQIPPGQEHASKPGRMTYLLLAAGFLIYLIVVYGDSVRQFFGFE